jgi:hypothetical protein
MDGRVYRFALGRWMGGMGAFLYIILSFVHIGLRNGLLYVWDVFLIVKLMR